MYLGHTDKHDETGMSGVMGLWTLLSFVLSQGPKTTVLHWLLPKEDKTPFISSLSKTCPPIRGDSKVFLLQITNQRCSMILSKQQRNT
jgi:hypothetical protein